jgi:hypothetical protein
MTSAPDAAAANFVVDRDVIVDDALVKFIFGRSTRPLTSAQQQPRLTQRRYGSPGPEICNRMEAGRVAARWRGRCSEAPENKGG